MRTLSEDAVAQLNGERLVIGGAARFLIGPGYRFWSGYDDLTLDGEVFQGIGARALITPISAQSGGAAEGAVIELSGLDPDVAATIENEDYHQRPVTIWRLVFSPDGATLLGSMIFMRGRLDIAPIVEGETSSIRFTIEGPRRDMGRRGSRIRSDADQRVLGGPTDGAFRNVSVAGRKTLYWGQRPTVGPASVSTVGGSSGNRGGATRPGTVRV
jgi:hypothetical protein